MADTITLLDRVKTNLRISHNALDAEIGETIAAARAELERLGISETKAEDDTDALITRAIITYCQYIHSNDEKLKDGFWTSWLYQIDCLRMTASYRAE